MSSRRDIPGDEPIEHDPTGMSALLSSLPDPGPMPAHLVERISTSLLTEQEHAQQEHAEHGQREHGQREKGQREKGQREHGDGHPLARFGRRRPGWRPIAAAIAVIGVGAGSLMTGTSPGDLAAILRGRPGTSSQSSAASAASMGPGSAGTGSSSALALPASGTVTIYLSGRHYDSGDLGGQAAELLRATPPTVPPLASEAPSIGPIATEAGLRGCAAALGLATTAGIAADIATVDGKPAAVLVVSQGARPTAYAVGRSCTTGRPDLIAGPRPVG